MGEIREWTGMSFNINGGSPPEHPYTHGKHHGGEEHANPFAKQLLGPRGWSQETNDQIAFSSFPAKEREPFSIKRAGKQFLKGVAHPFKLMLQHPFLTLGALAGTVALFSAAPITLPLMVIGGLGYSTFQLAKGGIKAYSAYQKGNFEEAEKAFADIGEGTLGLLSSFIGFRSSAAIAAEARTTGAALKEATTQAERLDAFQQGIDAASAAKYGSRGNALNEHFTLVTSAEGWRAIGAQFKPGTLFGNIRQQWNSLIGWFKTPSTPDVDKIAQEVQAFQEIPDHQMPRVLTTETSSNGTAAFYESRGKTVNVTTNYLEIFKNAQKQALESMQHLSPQTREKSMALIERTIDQLPSPLQNLLANWMRNKTDIENVLAHEIRHSHQHRLIENLSARQVEQLLDAQFEEEAAEIAKIAKQFNINQEELIQSTKQEIRKNTTGSLKLSETDATGHAFEEGKRAFLDFARGLSDNANRILDPAKFKDYIATPIEVDARKAGARFATRDAFEKLETGTEGLSNPLLARTIRNRLIEDRLNDILIQIGKLKKAKAPEADIQALEEEIKLLCDLPGSRSVTATLLKGEARLRDGNENPNTLGRKIQRATYRLIGMGLRPFIDKKQPKSKA